MVKAKSVIIQGEYDYVVVGCGFCGSVIARRLADEKNKKVLILEKRPHVAGNMYDEFDEHGILVQRYGVHVFRTDHESIFNYLSRFTEWFDYSITCLSEIKGKKVPVPFNFTCIDAFFSDKSKVLKDKLIKMFGIDRVPVLSLINSDDPDVKEFGTFLFEYDYRPYTAKQWGRDPFDIDVSILERVRIELSYDDRFFTNRYQCIPKHGFTKTFERMLDHPNITVKLNTDVRDVMELKGDRINIKGINPGATVIYTGALDSLFNFEYGDLPYRTLDFEYETHFIDYYQEAPFIVYPMHPTMTRITEFKYITGQKMKDKTTIVKEYPKEYVSNDDTNEPYYPVISDENKAVHKRYMDLSKKYSNLTICGRLADYEYYYMDSAVLRAFEVYESLTEGVK